jgi:hypothetical protein
MYEVRYIVCCAFHSRSLEGDNSTIKKCFAKCDFPVDHVYNNNENALKLTEAEENDWHSLQLLECRLHNM